MRDNELYHHGILGQRWGIRRFQNKDGSLTNAGKRHRKQQDDVEAKPKPKSIKDMTDDEIVKKINRLTNEKKLIELENDLKSLQPQKVSKGKAFAEKMWDSMIVPSAVDAGKKIFSSWLDTKGLEAMGLKKTSALDALKEEYNIKDYKKKIKDLDDALTGNKSESIYDKEKRLKAEALIKRWEKQLQDGDDQTPTSSSSSQTTEPPRKTYKVKRKKKTYSPNTKVTSLVPYK